jgi:hypothetical protein
LEAVIVEAISGFNVMDLTYFSFFDINFIAKSIYSHIATYSFMKDRVVKIYDAVIKTVGKGPISGQLYVPRAWIGKKVEINLLEPLEEA